jgi:hypothetical protein
MRSGKLLRIAGGLLGIGAAYMVVWVPISQYVMWANQGYPPHFWDAEICIPSLIMMAAFSAATYVFLRYAFTKQRPR